MESINTTLYRSKLIADYILDKIRMQDAQWKQVFSSSMRRIGDWELPTPDYVFQDLLNNKTFALFIAEDSHVMNDYYSIINAAVSVLSRHDYCGLILPRMSNGFLVGTKIEAKIYDDHLSSLPIAIIEYETSLLPGDMDSAIFLVRPIIETANLSIPKTRTENKSYWCWWRDASHFEVLQLMDLSDKYSVKKGDIYSNFIYPEFYEKLISGETMQWDGRPRKKQHSIASYRAEKQNYRIPLCQLGLVETSTCHLTAKGKRLLALGRAYGPDSTEFKNALAKIILIDGKHLDLIKDVVDFQRLNHSTIPESSEEFFVLLDFYLTDKNSIGTRKPSAVTTGAKKAYVRDEPKLWNKLGLIIAQTQNRYFRPFMGIEFNWKKINSILLSEW